MHLTRKEAKMFLCLMIVAIIIIESDRVCHRLWMKRMEEKIFNTMIDGSMKTLISAYYWNQSAEEAESWG